MGCARVTPSFRTEKFSWNGNICRFWLGGLHFEAQVGNRLYRFMFVQENTEIIFY